MAERDRARLLQLQREARRSVTASGVRVKSSRCHALLPDDRASRIDLRTITAFQRRSQFRYSFGARPHIAFVGLAGDKIHAPVIQSLVRDAPFA